MARERKFAPSVANKRKIKESSLLELTDDAVGGRRVSVRLESSVSITKYDSIVYIMQHDDIRAETVRFASLH